MEFLPTAIPNVILVKPKILSDPRGYFLETYSQRMFKEGGIDISFVQDNMSSSTKGTLRGLHYQLAPHAQGKLVRVIQGSVFDVAVDIRKNSPTFGKWVGEILSAENKLALYIPPGFAHGFYVLSESAEFAYKCTDFYNKASERGIIWNDPDVNIAWPLIENNLLLSERDQNNPLLKDAEINF